MVNLVNSSVNGQHPCPNDTLDSNTSETNAAIIESSTKADSSLGIMGCRCVWDTGHVGIGCGPNTVPWRILGV